MQRILSLFDPADRRRFYGLVVGAMFSALTEFISVAIVFPFLALLAAPEQITENVYLATVYTWSGSPPPRQFMIGAGLAVLMALFLSSAMGLTISYWRSWLQWGIYHRTSTRLLRYYTQLPYAVFLERNTSELRTYLTKESREFVEGILTPLLSIVIKGSSTVVIIGLLLLIDYQVAIFTALVLGAAYLALYQLRRKPLAQLGQQRLTADLRRHQHLDALFRGIKTVKIFGNEGPFLRQYHEDTLALARINPRLQVIYRAPRFLLELLAFSGIILITLVLYLRHGELGEILPTLTLFAVAGYRLLPALQELFGAASTMRTFWPTLEALETDVRASLALPATPVATSETALPLRQAIMLQKVSFTFPGAAQPLFRQFDLRIPCGSTIALTGSTGSGKTTLADLVAGLLSPTDGQVLIDEQPLEGLHLSAWRQQIAYVPQQIYLFDDTLRENLLFGHPAPPDDTALLAALAQVELLPFVRRACPAGLDTHIGEAGVRLSGGQQQRVGLARALLRRPSLLILDEATSALDNVTERAILRTLASLPDQLTILMIAHRLSTVKAADTILLLEQGKIVATGNYEQLLARSPAFRALAKGMVTGSD